MQCVEHERQIYKKENDKYLLSILEELKDKCIYENKKRELLRTNKRSSYGEEFEILNWNINHIDYNIDLCSTYCVSKYNIYDYSLQPEICNNCRQILDEKIAKKFNKSSAQLSQEVMLLQQEVNDLKKKVKEINNVLQSKM